jgi:hypothetical protein
VGDGVEDGSLEVWHSRGIGWRESRNECVKRSLR